MTQGSSEGDGELLPHPANPALHAVRTGPDLMTVAKPLGAWGILQAWTFWGLCSDGSTGFPGLGEISFFPLWDSHLGPVAIRSPAPGLG